MRIAVIGVGGVGGYFGGRLAQAGEDVLFVARGKTLDALRTTGLRVESIKGDFIVSPAAATDDTNAAGTADVVLIATKAWQVREAAELAKPMVGSHTIVIPLENGMEAPDELAAVLGPDHVRGGLCAIMSYIVEPGHIRHAAVEPVISFGRRDGASDPLCEKLHDAFVRVGVNATMPADITHAMWTKFLFIAPLSGIGAVTRSAVGAWRSVEETRAMADAALQEIVAVARARGVRMSDNAVATTMQRYDGLAADATSSLQRDIAEGKPSELEAQLGAVVRMGRESGIPTPVHSFLYASLLPQENRARGRS